MILAEQVGRRLKLTVVTDDDDTPIEPFMIPPVTVKVGHVLTGWFLNQSAGNLSLSEQQMEAMFAISLDGGVYDDEKQDVFARRDVDGNPITPNYTRSSDELTASEQEELFWKAFLWQSVLGHEGIAVYEAEDGGAAGMLKSMRLLMVRSGPQVLQRFDQTQQAGAQKKQSPTASNDDVPSASNKLPAPPTLDKLPKAKKSRNQNKG